GDPPLAARELHQRRPARVAEAGVVALAAGSKLATRRIEARQRRADLTLDPDRAALVATEAHEQELGARDHGLVEFDLAGDRHNRLDAVDWHVEPHPREVVQILLARVARNTKVRVAAPVVRADHIA